MIIILSLKILYIKTSVYTQFLDIWVDIISKGEVKYPGSDQIKRDKKVKVFRPNDVVNFFER